ncbi:MAG: nitrile hydratase subunit alpha [Acidobacteriota bacterium]
MAPHDDHDHDHQDPESPEIRSRALEELLLEKGLVSPEAIDGILSRYENDIGPMNGARLVARAWTDPGFKERLLDDGTKAAAELDLAGLQMDCLVVRENTRAVHNVVCCTLCSCYPWAVLGLPPAWYKDPAYRSRIVREPRKVLSEMGLDLDPHVEVQVWDSSAEVRYLVLPERPEGTEGMTEEELAEIVTRDSMIGVARLSGPGVRGGARVER